MIINPKKTKINNMTDLILKHPHFVKVFSICRIYNRLAPTKIVHKRAVEHVKNILLLYSHHLKFKRYWHFVFVYENHVKKQFRFIFIFQNLKNNHVLLDLKIVTFC